MDKYKVLKKYFGYDSFREGQEFLIDALLAGQDVFGIMPTGAGKILVLSGSRTFDGRYYIGCIAIDFFDEGSGGNLESGRDSCSVF